MSFSFSRIGTKLSLAKHFISKESQLADDPKSLAAILPLLTSTDDSANYELTVSGHGGCVGSLTLRAVGAIVTLLMLLLTIPAADAGPFGFFGQQQQGSCPSCANGQLQTAAPVVVAVVAAPEACKPSACLPALAVIPPLPACAPAAPKACAPPSLAGTAVVRRPLATLRARWQARRGG